MRARRRGVAVHVKLLLSLFTLLGLSLGPARAGPNAVRIEVRIDAQEMTLTISPARPAFVADTRWTQQLAIVVTDETKAGATLHVLLVAQGIDRATVTKEQVIKDAKLTRKVPKTGNLTIVPGSELPREAFGTAAPGKIMIRVVDR